MSYSICHTLAGLSDLFYLAKCPTVLLQMVEIPAFLWQNILRTLYRYTHISHIFFICSSVNDGDLSCFHVLAIVNNAAVNRQMQVFLQECDSLFLMWNYSKLAFLKLEKQSNYLETLFKMQTRILRVCIRVQESAF